MRPNLRQANRRVLYGGSSAMRRSAGCLVAAALGAAGPVSAEERHDAPTAQMPGVITKGSGDTSIGGLPAARKGDTTDRGDTLERGSPNVFINGTPAVTASDRARCGGGPER